MADTTHDGRTDHRRPATTATLAGTAVWRAAVIACGLIGLIGALADPEVPGGLTELSQQASLATAVIYAGLLVLPLLARPGAGRRFHEPRTPWWRGAIAVTLVVVMVIYSALLDTDFSTTHSQFEHLVTPIVVTLDVLFVGRNLLNVSWWSALTWLAFPLAYLVYYNVADLDAYDISIKVGDNGFWTTFPELLGGTVVVAAAFVAVGKLRASSAPWSVRR